MAIADESNFDDAFFDEDEASPIKIKMAQVKLELEHRDDPDLISFARTHAAAIVGKPLFATPTPSAVDFTTAVDAFEEAVDKIEELEALLAQAYTARDGKRELLKTAFRSRGGYVQEVTKGVAEDILSAALPVQDERAPITSLPAPGDLRASMGDMQGEIDLQWDRVEGTKSYLIEYREHKDGEEWKAATPSTRSRSTVAGLTPGKTYAFRVRALGSRGILSPWSDETVKMAP